MAPLNIPVNPHATIPPITPMKRTSNRQLTTSCNKYRFKNIINTH
jgi:hypothetical protein